jgi:hypothetical protein
MLWRSLAEQTRRGMTDMAKKKAPNEPDRLRNIEDRLARLEVLLWLDVLRDKHSRIAAKETAIDPWRFLVRRQHPWRKQLYLQGRNLTARQLVGAMKANQLDDEAAAANYHLPVAAVREALAYVEESRTLLETEAEIEWLMHQREGGAHATEAVS